MRKAVKLGVLLFWLCNILSLHAQSSEESAAEVSSQANVQHQLVSRSDAERATIMLPKGTYVTLLCGCCDDGKATIIEIDKAYYKPSSQKDLFEVWIEGKLLATYALNFRHKPSSVVYDSSKIEPMSIDLAYTFAQPNVFVPGNASKNAKTDFAMAYTMKLPLKDPKECVYEVPSAYIVAKK